MQLLWLLRTTICKACLLTVTHQLHFWAKYFYADRGNLVWRAICLFALLIYVRRRLLLYTWKGLGLRILREDWYYSKLGVGFLRPAFNVKDKDKEDKPTIINGVSSQQPGQEAGRCSSDFTCVGAPFLQLHRYRFCNLQS